MELITPLWIIGFLLTTTVSEVIGQEGYLFRSDTLYYQSGEIYGFGGLNGDTLDGFWCFHNESGELVLSGNFSNGYPTGEWESYFFNGVYSKGLYKAHKPVVIEWFTLGVSFLRKVRISGNVDWGFEDSLGSEESNIYEIHKITNYGTRNMFRVNKWLYYNEKGEILDEYYYSDTGEFLERIRIQEN